MNLPFNDVRDAAIELRDGHFKGFSLLPYSRFNAARSKYWWIVPEAVNPAYHFGKIELAADEAEPDVVLVGFSVEKGFGEEATDKKSEVMKPNWFWHDFLDRCNMPLAGAVEQANDAIAGGVQIHVGSGMPNAKQTDARVVFDTQNGTLTRSKYVQGDELLAELAESDSFATFADRLRSLDGTPSQWHWMGVMVGAFFTLDPDGEDDRNRCAEMLKPFQQWMRAAKAG